MNEIKTKEIFLVILAMKAKQFELYENSFS